MTDYVRASPKSMAMMICFFTLFSLRVVIMLGLIRGDPDCSIRCSWESILPEMMLWVRDFFDIYSLFELLLNAITIKF